jgi:hypothetical protein
MTTTHTHTHSIENCECSLAFPSTAERTPRRASWKVNHLHHDLQRQRFCIYYKMQARCCVHYPLWASSTCRSLAARRNCHRRSATRLLVADLLRAREAPSIAPGLIGFLITCNGAPVLVVLAKLMYTSLKLNVLCSGHKYSGVI